MICADVAVAAAAVVDDDDNFAADVDEKDDDGDENGEADVVDYLDCGLLLLLLVQRYL